MSITITLRWDFTSYSTFYLIEFQENNTFLSALYCRAGNCNGFVIPAETKTLKPNWRCTTCETIFPYGKMSRYQDFTLNAIHNRINSVSVSEMINFINNVCPKICPATNYVLIEAKLNVIWRMSQNCNTQSYSLEELRHRDDYCRQILQILDKLGAGSCTLSKLLKEEIKL